MEDNRCLVVYHAVQRTPFAKLHFSSDLLMWGHRGNSNAFFESLLLFPVFKKYYASCFVLLDKADDAFGETPSMVLKQNDDVAQSS